MSHANNNSPPPLRHPVPTHPAYIPEPPSTPASPQGYQRFSSSPAPGQTGGYPQPHAPPHLQGYAAHVPAYTSPFPNAPPVPQQYHHPMQQPPMSNPRQAPQNAPDFGAWGLDNTTATLGMQLGQSAVAAGQDYVQKNFGSFLPAASIKHHFNVSNSYVIKKMQLVLFPWLHKPWSRRPRAPQGEYMPPRDDLNSPDLYIPVMAVVTYIIFTALLSGIEGKFHPQILGEAASRAMIVMLLDCGFVKLGCYVLNIQGSSQFVDILAYGGYKFVGVLLTLTTTFLGLKGFLWTLVFTYTFLANGFFLLRSLRAVVLPDAASVNPSHAAATVTHAQRRRRIGFLLFEAFMQVLYMGWLVRI
ncbi:YIF1-domain-containing protein [Panaeolus papilionaceus]|nr:YIF1-domain-containing protein [Panaeolus papilionaceus]